MFFLRKKVDVIILYEKASRELEIATYFKYYLENRHGYKVVILQQNIEILSALKYIPRLVVLPFCYQNRSNNFFISVWRKAKFINLSWEQLFYSGNRIAKTPKGEFPTKYVIHHAWSNDYYSYLLSVGIPSNNIYINGNLSLKLYQQPYSSFYKNPYKVTLNVKHYRKKILFSENFNWAFYSSEMITQMIDDGQKKEDIDVMVNYANKSFEVLVEWAFSYLFKNIDTLLIFRPRPATSEEQISKKIHSLGLTIPPNFVISKEGNIREWIINSDIIISTYSTTIIEAISCGKKAFMLDPIGMPESLKVHWHKYSYIINQYSEFEALLSEVKEVDFSNFHLWIKQTFFVNDDPIRAMSDFLISQLSNYKYPIPPVRSLSYKFEDSKYSLVIFYLRLLIFPFIHFWNRIFRFKKNEYYKDYLEKSKIDAMLFQWSIVFNKSNG